MIEQLRTKVDEDAIPVVVGDMATATAPGEYTLVYLVFNTISNLLTQEEQVACFRNAARHLAARRAVRDRAVGARTCAGCRRVSRRRSSPPSRGTSVWTPTTWCGSRWSRTTSGSTRAGRRELFRSPHRYIWPAELDLMARLAGFELESRHADWAGDRVHRRIPLARVGVPAGRPGPLAPPPPTRVSPGATGPVARPSGVTGATGASPPPRNPLAAVHCIRIACFA